MRIRFSITAMLIGVALIAAGVVYWKSQQPFGVYGAGYRPTTTSVHFIVESYSDQQELELALQKNGVDDPQFTPIPVILSAGKRIELLFENEKFLWFDSRIHKPSTPEILKDISNEIKSGGPWICTPGHVRIAKNWCGNEAIQVFIVDVLPDMSTIRYTLLVRERGLQKKAKLITPATQNPQ